MVLLTLGDVKFLFLMGLISISRVDLSSGWCTKNHLKTSNPGQKGEQCSSFKSLKSIIQEGSGCSGTECIQSRDGGYIATKRINGLRAVQECAIEVEDQQDCKKEKREEAEWSTLTPIFYVLNFIVLANSLLHLPAQGQTHKTFVLTCVQLSKPIDS